MTDSAKALIRQPLNSEPASLADSDYDSILGAVIETARGRWFLHEYARRNRNADTGTLLAAIDRIESLLKTRDREYAKTTPVAVAPPDVTRAVAQLRDIAENLVECGAPLYLCNDLMRRIEQLALAFRQPAEAEAATEPVPVALMDSVAVELPRDPFADIMALSPEERIALFS